jgi:hypothetical protein
MASLSTAALGSSSGSSGDEPYVCESHGTFSFGGITFSSDFDNGNLRRVVPVGQQQPLDFNIWTAPDNAGSEVESNHCSWYYFSVSGLPKNATLKIVSVKKFLIAYKDTIIIVCHPIIS